MFRPLQLSGVGVETPTYHCLLPTKLLKKYIYKLLDYTNITQKEKITPEEIRLGFAPCSESFAFATSLQSSQFPRYPD